MRTIALLVFFALTVFAQTKDLHRSFPLTAQGRVTVDTYKGSVRVTTWEKNEVDVSVRIEGDSLLGGDQDAVDAADVEFQGSSTLVAMRSNDNRWKRHSAIWESAPLVHYTIRMPRQASLRIKDYKSLLIISGLSSELDLETYKGQIEVKAHNGGARIKNYKSEARVEFAALPSAVTLETYKGDYELRVPRGAAFDLVSRLGRRGTLDSSFPLTRPSSRNSSEFTASVNGGGPPVTIKGYRGTYRFR